MTIPAFMVDGQMEQRIAQKLCGGDVPVRVVNPNGRSVSISAIAKQVASQFRLLSNRYYPVVVLLDREDRESTPAEISTELATVLQAEHNVPTNQLVIGVADRMIENWILADPACDSCILAGVYEGTNGKHILRQMLVQKDITYHETTVGVDLFCKINPTIAAQNSTSFQQFFNQLKAHCKWFKV